MTIKTDNISKIQFPGAITFLAQYINFSVTMNNMQWLHSECKQTEDQSVYLVTWDLQSAVQSY